MWNKTDSESSQNRAGRRWQEPRLILSIATHESKCKISWLFASPSQTAGYYICHGGNLMRMTCAGCWMTFKPNNHPSSSSTNFPFSFIKKELNNNNTHSNRKKERMIWIGWWYVNKYSGRKNTAFSIIQTIQLFELDLNYHSMRNISSERELLFEWLSKLINIW